MKVTPKKSDYDAMMKQIESEQKTDNVMKTVIHRANERGYANHGWLEANHSFSFANWYNPEKIHFGALRVLNDDKIAPGMGFGTHPHDNMEIITIPMEGALAHKDSMGNGETIFSGDIQVMSAGTGILHSEFNAKSDAYTKLFQIWVFPRERGVEPRYQQLTIDKEKMNNALLQLVSPNPEDEGAWIHQDAWFHMGKFDANLSADYELKGTGTGVYAFVIEGKVSIDGNELNRRDAIGLWETNKISLNFVENSTVLLMEVPMEI